MRSRAPVYLHGRVMSTAGSLGLVHQPGRPPEWLMGPAAGILNDLHGAQPTAGLQIVAISIDGVNGLTVGVLEPSRASDDLAQLPDDLEPDDPTNYGEGNWVPRSLTGPELLVLIADILQEDLAETAVAWGQARPPCPTIRTRQGPSSSTGKRGGSASATSKRCIASGKAKCPPTSRRRRHGARKVGGRASDSIDNHADQLECCIVANTIARRDVASGRKRSCEPRSRGSRLGGTSNPPLAHDNTDAARGTPSWYSLTLARGAKRRASSRLVAPSVRLPSTERPATVTP